MLGIWKPHPKRGKIRLSTVMMTSGKKRNTFLLFPPKWRRRLKSYWVSTPQNNSSPSAREGEWGGALGASWSIWRGWSQGGEIKAEIKSLDQKLTPKNSRAEFPSLRNPHNGLNDITRKKQRKLKVCGCLFIVPSELFLIWYSTTTRPHTYAVLQCTATPIFKLFWGFHAPKHFYLNQGIPHPS